MRNTIDTSFKKCPTNNNDTILTKDVKKKIEEILKNIPVSINNYFGDPTLQWQNTLTKLDSLLSVKHSWPIWIITKWVLNNEKCTKLKFYKDAWLNIIVLVSISELKEFEKVWHSHRYDNIRRLNDFWISNIAYIRPMTPPYNTNKETLDYIFTRLKMAGAKNIVASWFRWDDDIVSKMSPEQKMDWVLRIKQMQPEIHNYIREKSKEFWIQYFTRTSCAISCISWMNSGYNPYYNSPSLVKCEEINCPIIDTCRTISKPKEWSIEFLKMLWYELEFIEPDITEKCQVKWENRLKCRSCCTTCYMLKAPHISVKWEVSLWDLTFIRFVTWILAMQPGKKDDWWVDIANVKFPNYPEITWMHCLNSWWVMAKIGEKCFGCKYCISEYYKWDSEQEFGFPPSEIMDKIF